MNEVDGFSSLRRKEYIQTLTAGELDLLVIGGGITGSGIALDAQARGLRTGLVEMQDFAAGTSSRSTKLVHGGLRYLKQLEFGLVAEVGSERAIVHANGLHITRPETMLLPIVKGGSMGKTAVRLGMWLYESLARVRKEEWHRMLDRKETLAHEPMLAEDRLLGGVLFYEYRTDDARLTIEVLKKAVSLGAIAVNYMTVTGFLYRDGRVSGVKVRDTFSGESYEIRARRIINASGPWVDHLGGLDNPKAEKKLHVTKGVHIVVDHKKLPLKHSVYFDTMDKRMVFAIPREGKVYIGTTDNFYHGSHLENPGVTEEDCRYLIDTANSMFPSSPLSLDDIESSWSGLRPLVQKAGKGPSEISRKDEIFLSPTGLLTIAGGKLTGYRKMAERIVNLVAKQLKKEEGLELPPCTTATIRLSGGDIEHGQFGKFVEEAASRGAAAGLKHEEAEKLAGKYGSNISRMYEYAHSYDSTKHMIPLPLYLQLIYAIKEEMTTTPADFFVRRTGALFFHIEQVHQWKEPVSRIMAAYLGWDEHRRSSLLNELDTLLAEAVPGSQSVSLSKV